MASNIEIIRGFYDAWLAGDAERAVETFAPDIELYTAPEAHSFFPDLDDVYYGIAGVQQYMRLVYESFDEYRAEIEELIDAGDRVLTLAIESGRGKLSGARAETKTAHVWTLRDGKVVRLDLIWDRARLVDAGFDARLGRTA